MSFLVEELVCRFCDHTLEPGVAVCHSCGCMLESAADIVHHHESAPDTLPHCPNCQVELRAGAEVCHSCGSLLV